MSNLKSRLLKLEGKPQSEAARIASAIFWYKVGLSLDEPQEAPQEWLDNYISSNLTHEQALEHLN